MKKLASIRNQFGLTQQEMATLLNVSRPLLALYETGRRELPTHALIKMSELTIHVQAQQKVEKEAIKSAKSDPIIAKTIEGLLRENEYRQLINKKKIAALLKKQDKIAKLTDLAAALNIQEAKKEQQALYTAITNRGLDDRDAGNSVILFNLELKQELLEAEKAVLQGKLK